jgi:hypothetical protein
VTVTSSRPETSASALAASSVDFPVITAGNVLPINEWTEEMSAQVASVEIVKRNQTAGDTVIKVKFWNKNQALELMHKHLGLLEAGIRVVQTPVRAPNANAHAERFVRSIMEECLDRIIPLGERHFRRAVTEFVHRYHRERNHQGLKNTLIEGSPSEGTAGRVHRRPHLGGLLNYYERAA